MLRPSQLGLLLSVIAAASVWLYVQAILIPFERAQATALGIPRGNLSDLYPRWLGTRELLLHGRDPYRDDITREIQAGYYGRPIDGSRPYDPKDQQAFAYPLYVVFVLSPTVRLPFAAVQKGFLCLLILLTAGSVLWWLRALRWHLSMTWRVMWIVLVLGYFPTVQGLKLQQLTLLVAALIAAAMYGIVRRYFVWSGCLLALASIKPQLVLLLAIWLLLWVSGNWRERQRLLWSYACSMAALFVASELLMPGWIGKFCAACAAYYQYTGGGRSVLDVALTPMWGRPASVILVVGLLILVWRLRRAEPGTIDFQWSVAAVMAMTLVVIPMYAPYNQPLLLPAAMVCARGIHRLWQKSLLSGFLVVCAGASLFWPWLAAAGLVGALLFLPAATVQRAWLLPLYTTLTIPIALLALLLAGRSVLSSDGGGCRG